MATREIQSVEVSCIIHATEDAGRVERSVMESLSVSAAPVEETLQGHFGNPIIHARWHLTGEDAWTAFERLIRMIGPEGRAEIRRDFARLSDEHGSLYFRLNKQMLVKGEAAFSLSDPVRIRVKPRGFMMKGAPAEFYERLLARVER